MRPILLAALLLAAPAFAAEDFTLRPGPGADVAAANCAACHSLDYIAMNSPFLDRAGWTAEVNKMANVFHAPIDRALLPQIIEYLSSHYGR